MCLFVLSFCFVCLFLVIVVFFLGGGRRRKGDFVEEILQFPIYFSVVYFLCEDQFFS